AIAAAFFEHGGELRPRRLARMLAAELALAVAPARGRDHRCHALIDAAATDRDRGAEARAEHRDTLAVDVRMLRQQRERVAGRRHLVGAEQKPLLALALAAAGHVEAHADIAEPFEHGGRPHHVVSGHPAAEAVQDDEGRTLLVRFHALRHPDNAGEFQALGCEADALLGHRPPLSPFVPAKAGTQYSLKRVRLKPGTACAGTNGSNATWRRLLCATPPVCAPSPSTRSGCRRRASPG